MIGARELLSQYIRIIENQCCTILSSRLPHKLYIKKFLRKYYSHISNYLVQNGLTSKAQHGFLKAKSTTTNLLECLDDWTEAVDDGKMIDVIYLDLAKAFDSVSINNLIYELEKIGFGGNILFWI